MAEYPDVPRRQGSPTTIRSSVSEGPGQSSWPLHAHNNAHFVSPSDHYFDAALFQTPNAPFDFERRDEEWLAEKEEHFPSELPQKPPRPFIRHVPLIHGYEIPLRPHITRARRHIKNPIPLSWRTGFDRLYASWVENWWLWELLSWVVSALCMGVIALILLVFENKSVPESDITLNSIISVLAGVAKAALLLPTAECLGQMKWSWFWRDTKKVEDFETFDMASRGPWGSLVLLWRTKGRSLATFGAIIIVVSIALDPFFQQLVVFEQHWIPTQQNSTIPRAVEYSNSFGNLTQGGEPMALADKVMDGFVGPYIFGEEWEPEVPIFCPSSNCTWDTYQSLSVCSACKDVSDVSDILFYDCIEVPIDWFSSVGNPDNKTELTTKKACGYFMNHTSEDPVLMAGYIPTLNPQGDDPEVLLGRIFPLTDTNALMYGVIPKTHFGGSINFRDVPNPLLDFLVVNTPGGLGDVYANTKPSAQECVLSWCVQNFQSTVYIGNLTTQTVGDPVQPHGQADFPWSADSLGVLYDKDFTYSPPGSNEEFKISNVTIVETMVLLGQYFPMTVTTSNQDRAIKYRFSNMDTESWVRTMVNDSWNDIPARVNGLAKVMTRVMSASLSGTTNVTGIAWADEVFVSVRWEWFSLPFALLLLSLVFLLTTIFKGAEEEQDIGIWKTSALPVLINGLRGDVRRKMGNSNKMADIRSRANDTEMKLLLSKKGYRLSGMPASVWASPPEQNGRSWI